MGAACPDASILLATGTEELEAFSVSAAVDLLRLPGLRKLANDRYAARRLAVDAADILALRAGLLATVVERFRPDVVLSDKYPGGVQNELVPALQRLRLSGGSAVLGLRDVLDAPERAQREWRERAATQLLLEFDHAVLVYGQQGLLGPAGDVQPSGGRPRPRPLLRLRRRRAREPSEPPAAPAPCRRCACRASHRARSSSSAPRPSRRAVSCGCCIPRRSRPCGAARRGHRRAREQRGRGPLRPVERDQLVDPGGQHPAIGRLRPESGDHLEGVSAMIGRQGSSVQLPAVLALRAPGRGSDGRADPRRLELAAGLVAGARLAAAHGLRLRATVMRDTDRDLTSVVVVRTDSPITELDDLAGKTVACGAIDSPQATLLPLAHLRVAGLAPGADFAVRRFDVGVGLHGDHIGGERDAARSSPDHR